MRLEIQCEDRIGMVREVLDLFMPHQIDIRLIEVDSKRHCIYCGFPDIAFAQLQTLLAELRRLDGVQDVKTVMFTPSEREHNALHTLLEALPDGVISVDLKGYITLVTKLAAQDLGVTIGELMSRPLQQFIKGVSFAKVTWDDIVEGVSLRVRLQGKPFLLEMKPIFVPDEDGHSIPAGAVVHLKSQARLDRQAANFKQAPEAEKPLESYFKKEVIKSTAMRDTLRKAKVFSIMTEPLLIQGDVGTGKKELLRAMYQYWLKQQPNREGELFIRHASDASLEDIAKLDHLSGWFVIEDVEYLAPSVQLALVTWLNRHPEFTTSFHSAARLVCLTSLAEHQLIEHRSLDSALYFALSTLCLTVPSLKARREDLEGLIDQTLQRLSERHSLAVPSISKPALMKMSLYRWPGNIKELENVCLRTLSLQTTSSLQADDVILVDDGDEVALTLIEGSLDKTMKQMEASLLRRLYPHHPSTRRLAKAVGLSHSAVANKLKEYGIGD